MRENLPLVKTKLSSVPSKNTIDIVLHGSLVHRLPLRLHLRYNTSPNSALKPKLATTTANEKRFEVPSGFYQDDMHTRSEVYVGV